MKLSLSFVLISLLYVSCHKNVAHSNTIAIQVGKCKQYNSSKGTLTCCLDSVIEDSRCPANTNCIWAGYAAARFSITNRKESHVVVLVPGTDSTGTKVFPTKVSAMGYNINFNELSPYPGLAPYNYGNYKAVLKITE